MQNYVAALIARRDYLNRWKYFLEQLEQPDAVKQHEFQLLLEQIGWLERFIALAEQEVAQDD